MNNKKGRRYYYICKMFQKIILLWTFLCKGAGWTKWPTDQDDMVIRSLNNSPFQFKKTDKWTSVLCGPWRILFQLLKVSSSNHLLYNVTLFRLCLYLHIWHMAHAAYAGTCRTTLLHFSKWFASFAAISVFLWISYNRGAKDKNPTILLCQARQDL